MRKGERNAQSELFCRAGLFGGRVGGGEGECITPTAGGFVGDSPDAGRSKFAAAFHHDSPRNSRVSKGQFRRLADHGGQFHRAGQFRTGLGGPRADDRHQRQSVVGSAWRCERTGRCGFPECARDAGRGAAVGAYAGAAELFVCGDGKC